MHGILYTTAGSSLSFMLFHWILTSGVNVNFKFSSFLRYLGYPPTLLEILPIHGEARILLCLHFRLRWFYDFILYKLQLASRLLADEWKYWMVKYSKSILQRLYTQGSIEENTVINFTPTYFLIDFRLLFLWAIFTTILLLLYL